MWIFGFHRKIISLFEILSEESITWADVNFLTNERQSDLLVTFNLYGNDKNVQLLFCPEMIEKIYRLIYNLRGIFIMEK
ncbi:hypothetical protein DW914_16015 [Roseburia inulinivorans]|jgi:hypothetical protein|uniref:Uncharacterized protein n=1 Tax=Roseburia inulinivorans TaxID=360807 RepID=A0A413TG43_9FIRM|nr:hypothetical protein DW914_16015 [Roseburia inulinivorans]